MSESRRVGLTQKRCQSTCADGWDILEMAAADGRQAAFAGAKERGPSRAGPRLNNYSSFEAFFFSASSVSRMNCHAFCIRCIATGASSRAKVSVVRHSLPSR